MEAELTTIHVVAGVLENIKGQILLTQRKVGSAYAGLWEFPGGKREPGEATEQTLKRELFEELGIETVLSTRLIRIPWRSPEKVILLDVYRVISYRGIAYAREGQGLRWRALSEIDPNEILPADRSVLSALKLPAHYAITPATSSLEGLAVIEKALSSMSKKYTPLIQFRMPQLNENEIRKALFELLKKCQEYELKLLVNSRIDLALEMDTAGVHLTASQLFELDQRPLPHDKWVGASCHNVEELQRAAQINVDFATLSPVCPTSSHPEAKILGWKQFAEGCEMASFPVYALGGLTPDDLSVAQSYGAQGIAGISTFWPQISRPLNSQATASCR